MDSYPSFQNPNIENFIKRNHVAVLATANKQTGAPHASTIYYTVSSSLNIFFLTKKDTQKNKNIETNPQVALAIYEAQSQSIAQITGNAQAINEPGKIQTALRIMRQYSQQTAGTDEIPLDKLDAGEFILYKVTPNTVRLGEYKYGPRGEVFDTAIPTGESLE
jgi:nitroimidazol reductase NimA-like FMN-containing flavoprotein (pyridoxamine 5'-phosphate oxidase superfamily)